jgi:hypothetical protein
MRGVETSLAMLSHWWRAVAALSRPSRLMRPSRKIDISIRNLCPVCRVDRLCRRHCWGYTNAQLKLRAIKLRPHLITSFTPGAAWIGALHGTYHHSCLSSCGDHRQLRHRHSWRVRNRTVGRFRSLKLNGRQPGFWQARARKVGGRHASASDGVKRRCKRGSCCGRT